MAAFSPKSVVLGLATVALSVLGVLSECDTADDGSTVVPAPDAVDRAATVRELDRAATAQGICYGWQLAGSGLPASVGSNLGDGVSVTSSPDACPRWIEVRARVEWTPASSEAEDSSSVEVVSSDSLERGISAEALQRFGLDHRTFVDDPGDAVLQAVTVLPLLAAENGLATAVPSAAPTGPVPTDAADLADSQRDFWRQRLWMVLASGIMLLVAGVIAVFAWLGRRSETAAAGRRKGSA
jgi:hypothetical protein